MKPYFLESLAEFEEIGEKITSSKCTPAAAYLFNVDEKAAPLSKKVAKRYQKIVVKLLFICCRGRPDINVGISYLTMRVSKSIESDLRKLKRLMHYIYGTLDLVLKLSAISTTVITRWIDAAYGLHDNMRSHTGTTMSMGLGSIYSMCKKQKSNTKS